MFVKEFRAIACNFTEKGGTPSQVFLKEFDHRD